MEQFTSLVNLLIEMRLEQKTKKWKEDDFCKFL